LAGGGGTRYLITGSGFAPEALAAIDRLPNVRSLSRSDGALEIELARPGESTEVIRTLIGSGACLDEVKRSRASLEELFLTLMEENNAH
jgi:ABC-2 type transport system ATP-binding protein